MVIAESRLAACCRGLEGTPDGQAARGLEIAVIGDSLTTGFYVSSPLSMIWSARRRRDRNWFYDNTGSIQSLVLRLGQYISVVPYQYATVSAKVDPGGSRSLLDYLGSTRHF